MSLTRLLIPGFLKQFDGWLLKNQPAIWRTRIHYVLFYSAIVCNLLIFGFYHGFPLTTEMLGDDFSTFRAITLIFGGFALLFWGWELRKFAFKGKSFTNVMLTLLIYWLGCASIGVNLWAVNKTLGFKVAALVEDEVVEEDLTYLYSLEGKIKKFNRESTDFRINYSRIDESLQESGQKQASENSSLREENRPKWKSPFNINDLILRYGIPIQLNQDAILEPSGFTPRSFLDQYNVFALDAIDEIRQKIYVINRAKRIESWTSVEYSHRDIYHLFFLGLLGLPLLGLLISNTSIVTIVSLAFAHVLLFVGMVLTLRGDGFTRGDFGFRYIILTSIGIVLMLLLQRNWKPFRLIHLFVMALIPISFLFFQLDINEALTNNYHFSVWKDLFKTFVVTAIGGMTFWFFRRRITKPGME